MAKLYKLMIYDIREVLSVFVDKDKKLYQWYWICPKCGHTAKTVRFHCTTGQQCGWAIACCDNETCKYQFVIIG